MIVSQKKYTLDIFDETSMLDSKLVDTPMDTNVKFVLGQEEPLRDVGRYRQLVGKPKLPRHHSTRHFFTCECS